MQSKFGVKVVERILIMLKRLMLVFRAASPSQSLCIKASGIEIFGASRYVAHCTLLAFYFAKGRCFAATADLVRHWCISNVPHRTPNSWRARAQNSTLWARPSLFFSRREWHPSCPLFVQATFCKASFNI